MPNSRFRIPLPHPLGFITLVLSLAFSDARAQLSYSESRLNSTAQRVLPSTGPGSALSNPAALGETKFAFIQSGNFHARSGYFPSLQLFGTDVTGYTQIAVTPTAILLPNLPVAISVGFAFASNDTKIDDSKSLYQESMFEPGLAISWPAEPKASTYLALGAALPSYRFNAFNVVESRTTGLDLGLLGAVPLERHKFRLGLTWQHALQPKIKLPEGFGNYTLPLQVEASLHWTSPGEMFQAHWQRYLWSSHDPEDGPATKEDVGIGSWEVEVRPTHWLGFKFERPHDGELTSLGLVLQPLFGNASPRLEWNISHDELDAPPPEWLFGESRDESSGLVQSLTLSVGI